MAAPLDEHYDYLCDRVKLERYKSVLDELSGPGRMVMDLGCGSGILGLMALHAGAEKVFFVEEDPIIEVARRTVVSAGYEDRAIFINKNSFEWSTTERVDVIVCDHVGYFGFDYGILALLADARQRFLKPGGIVVPDKIELLLGCVESPKGREIVSRWDDGSSPEEFSWIRNFDANAKHSLESDASELLATPARLSTIELGATVCDFMSWQVDVQFSRNGYFDGLLGWFDCLLHENVRMTNSPLANERLDRPQAFLPLESPIQVNCGERLSATIMVRPADHIIAWTVALPDQSLTFSMDTFSGLFLGDKALNRTRPDRIAQLNDRGQAHQVVFSYCDGSRTVAEVEAMVQEKHPNLFPSAEATKRFVRKALAWGTDG